MSTDFSCWEEHSNRMASEINKAMAKKYCAGQKEHGGQLWRKPMLDHMLAEIVDLVHYYLTHRAQVARALEVLEYGYPSYTVGQRPEDTAPVTKAYNILKYGNEDGVTEEELAPDTWAADDLQPQLPVEEEPVEEESFEVIDDDHPYTEAQLDDARSLRDFTASALKEIFPDERIELNIHIGVEQ